MGAVLREQNALPYEARNKAYPLAKDTINNGEAGRAAKGTNPSACPEPWSIMFQGFFLLEYLHAVA